MTLTPIERWSLQWLAKQQWPMWGGHLKRGEPLSDNSIKAFLVNGLIAQREGGYVITDKGRELSGAKPVRCPTCGHKN